MSKYIYLNDSDFLQEIDELYVQDKRIKTYHNDKIEDLFSANIVPLDNRNQILRPIEEFYRGMPPKWSDILRNVIFKTSHFRSIEDSIFNKHRHTIIIGSPLSGKTTLAMQVACFIQFDGIKLMFNNINKGRAEYIAKLLSNKKALIIIENFTDDIDCLNILKELTNIKIVAIDRSHNFGYISHYISIDDFDIINVTPLNDFDIQGILDTIPDGIKRDTTEIKFNHDTDNSFFELIIRHIKGESINSRYKDFICKLEKEDKDLAEFLVLCAYMHNSRVPLSMEVAYSYFSDYEYDNVICMRQQLSDLLQEDDAEELAQNNIDGYRPRSSITSDAILKYASSNLLANVMNNLLERVAYVKICNYRTFRRWAFDKAIVSKAFPKWDEGKAFYQKAFMYDNRNAYVLQQGALYLSSKRKYQDAFDWIDRAKILTNDKQFSIRNSHAIILFDANYEVNSQEAMEQLDRSMEILCRCYYDDMRKTFHAKTYADQAIRYFRKYMNEKSIEYLEQSKRWLKEEIKNKAWAYDLKSLERKIQ